MKPFKIILLLLFFSIHFCKAQDTAVLITRNMFDKTNQTVLLTRKDGWIFKQGNNPAWAKEDIDTTGWRKLKPTQLSPKFADKNGKVECWFRIKIKLDSSFENKPLGFKTGTWAATDFYIDGKLVFSSGSTGSNGPAYRENRPLGSLPFNVSLKPGTEYTGV